MFKLQGAIGKLFRDYLDTHGFTEIHSPKLQGAATESGASVFKVSYFKGKMGFFLPVQRLTLSRQRLPRPIAPAREADVHRVGHGARIRDRPR